MKKSTAVARYSIDQIEGVAYLSKAFIKKAAVLGSNEYEIVRQLRAAGYPFKPMDETKKAANINKNLTYAKMQEHIKAVEGDNAMKVLDEMTNVKALSAIQSKPYKYVRDWFLKKYPDVRPASKEQEGTERENTPEAMEA